ncbi:MAG: hypothetical protein K2O45_17105 [Oscillospiraceae bacterium]|nr:hypothetical protein [Oscillospiraceae bacterium]
MIMDQIQKICFRSSKCRKQIALLLFLAVILGVPACAPAGEDFPHPESKEGVLTYAALNPLTPTQKRYIFNFNNKHPDAQIEVLDYSDEGGVERLLTELTLGWVPDIIELHRIKTDDRDWAYMGTSEGEYQMPYQQMARKGYLEDLWPYIENDPELGRDALLETPMKAAEVDGGLYMLFKEVFINTLIGETSVVGERDGWTIDELMETFAAAMPEESTILQKSATRREMYDKLYCTTLDQYIDWETGKCSFDNDEFRGMLEFLSAFPTEYKTDIINKYELEKDAACWILDGKQMLQSIFVSDLWHISQMDKSFGRERISCVGYPTTDGSSGSFFNIPGTILAMSSVCQDKEAAWEFMSYLVRPSASWTSLAQTSPRYLPVNRKDYEVGISLDMRDSSKSKIPLYFYQGGPNIFPDPPMKEDILRFEMLINNTKQIYWPNEALSDTVWDAIGPYFAGDKTLDETIQLVQNRVTLYVNENR